MIPRTLQIRNFLSYGDEPQTIDFRSYRLICLSGKNGHGKSALLDAMTWAVWGQARKVASSTKADEGLLRLGQDTMMVTFDFELQGIVYRVKREYLSRYGKPLASLDFGILDDATDTYKPLTGKTIRDTQAQIEQTIKLTFDSFTNSAFLRQGQSNEFSKKSPRERKEILGAILGLTEYDTIRKRALEKIRQESQARATIIALQQAIEQALATAPEIQRQSDIVHQQLQGLEQEQATHAQLAAALEAQAADIAQQQHQRAMAIYQKNTLRQEHQQIRTALTTKIAEWRSIHAQQYQRSPVAQLDTERTRLRTLLAHCQQSLQTTLSLKEAILAAKETAHILEKTHTQHQADELQKRELACERLQSDLLNYAAVYTDHERQRAATASHIKELTTQKITLLALQTQAHPAVQQLTGIEQQFLKRKTHYQKFIAHANWLSSQLTALEQKKTLVTQQQNPTCPLCQQHLPTARRQLLSDTLQMQAQLIAHQLTRFSAIIATLKGLLFDQHAQLELIKKTKETYLQREVTIAELEKQLVQHTAAHSQQHEMMQTILRKQTDAQQQLAALTDQRETIARTGADALKQNEIYQATIGNITKLEQELNRQEYHKTTHEQTQLQLAQIEQTLAHQQDLTAQLALQDARKQEILTGIAQVRTLAKSLKTVEHTVTHFSALDTLIQQHTQAREQYTSHLTQLNSRKETLLQQKGRLEQQLLLIAQQQEHRMLNQTKLTELESSIFDYEQIAAATSKDGIQALLIEDAIPEIEQTANDLLARLTNGNAQLFIESLKDLKGGGTKETLDIKISDSAGIRPYELFSGGEAFRIDFALRIAISKLLARRAGTALQTLIIDEGFGSQDDDGLGHIMDAMYTIQEDFQKIIIVSHLPSMKNQFPVHFVVEKRPSGSTVTVIEQD